MEFHYMLKNICINSSFNIIRNKRLAALPYDQKQGKPTLPQYCWTVERHNKIVKK